MGNPLETALDTVINVFHQYSTHKPHPDKLNNGELKQLIEKELAEFLKVSLMETDSAQCEVVWK
uniref:S100/CaBP-9k-type calcium binding subdomain domain-containing protein n=1 Tax=Varanus komodoensis TaxID=61221 RepID=A0A8D2IWJ4_VARKO